MWEGGIAVITTGKFNLGSTGTAVPSLILIILIVADAARGNVSARPMVAWFPEQSPVLTLAELC